MPKATPKPIAKPIIPLAPFQEEAFWKADDFGFTLLFWRRQGGKTHTLSARALRRMMEKPGRLVTYASASLAMGAELTLKQETLWHASIGELKSRDDLIRAEAATWQRNLAAWKAQTAAGQITSAADDVDFDGLCDLLDHSKFEVKLWHTKTLYSRTKIIAPNPATARSYSGDVIIDEIGFIRDLKDLWEAMEPIASRQQDFRVLMATTPPADDSHYSYELLLPPEGWVKGPANARGYWYDSQANVRVHRVDVFDAYEAGIKLYDRRTRQPITPAESRAQALDRDAWDRNYGLELKRGGVCALSLLAMKRAMDAGRDLCLASENDFPPGWADRLGDGPVAIGVDPATTEKEMSNPTGLCVLEEVGGLRIPRLIMRYKSADPNAHRAFIFEAVSGCFRVRNGVQKRPRSLVIDATNERLFAADIRNALAGDVTVYLVVASETTDRQGERVTYKTLMGNDLVNAIDDGSTVLPDVRWVKDDFRLVTKERGLFVNRLDAAGNHADTFDAAKLALYGLSEIAAPAEASPAQVGQYLDSGQPSGRSFWKPPTDELVEYGISA